jgi:hypothetical protein
LPIGGTHGPGEVHLVRIRPVEIETAHQQPVGNADHREPVPIVQPEQPRPAEALAERGVARPESVGEIATDDGGIAACSIRLESTSRIPAARK